MIVVDDGLIRRNDDNKAGKAIPAYDCSRQAMKGKSMFPEKPKRGKNKYRFLLALFVSILLISYNFDFGFYGDVFAMTVMICAAIYLVYQLVEWLVGKTWS